MAWSPRDRSWRRTPSSRQPVVPADQNRVPRVIPTPSPPHVGYRMTLRSQNPPISIGTGSTTQFHDRDVEALQRLAVALAPQPHLTDLPSGPDVGTTARNHHVAAAPDPGLVLAVDADGADLQ